MDSVTQQMTAEQLARLPDAGNRYELVLGELRMMSPAGNRHGDTAMNLAGLLWNHVRANRLGKVYAAETGFLLTRDPDTVRAPDVSFVWQDQLTQYHDHSGFLPLAPDFVAEVVSLSDSFVQVEQKALAWLEAGVRLVLVVEPENRTIREYVTKDTIRIWRAQDELDVSEVVPGWKLRVADVFS